MKMCSVLDTEAGPYCFRRGDFQSIEAHSSLGLKPNISDTKGLPLKIVENEAFYIRFETYIVNGHFYVFERVYTAYLLGRDFYDRFV